MSFDEQNDNINMQSLDLINRADLLNKRVYSCRKGHFPYKRAYQNLLYDIEHAPVVDIESLVKSQQKNTNNQPETSEWVGVSPLVDSEECKVCRYNIQDKDLRTPFCPWCGRLMKNFKEDNDAFS